MLEGELPYNSGARNSWSPVSQNSRVIFWPTIIPNFSCSVTECTKLTTLEKIFRNSSLRMSNSKKVTVELKREKCWVMIFWSFSRTFICITLPALWGKRKRFVTFLLFSSQKVRNFEQVIRRFSVTVNAEMIFADSSSGSQLSSSSLYRNSSCY